MREFLKYCLKLILIIVVIILCTYGVNRFIFYQNHKTTYQKNLKTLVIGDSKFRTINPHLVADDCINLFQDGDTYEVMYYKLKMVDNFNDLNQLVVAFSYNNFAPIAEERILHTEGMLKRIFALTSLSEIISYNQNYKGLLSVLTKNIFSINTRYLNQYLFGDLKRYSTFDTKINFPKKHKPSKKNKNWYNSEQGRTNAINKMIGHQFSPNIYTKMDNQNSEHFLKKILAYSNKHDIKVYLVTMPLDPNFKKEIPKLNKERFVELKKGLDEAYIVKFLDFSSEFDKKTHFLKNQNHSNSDGGAIISHLISQRLI